MNHYHIGAHLADLGLNTSFRTLPDGEHGDDGGYSDDDAQHGQKASEFVVAQGFYGYFKQIGQIHGQSSSTGRDASVRAASSMS